MAEPLPDAGRAGAQGGLHAVLPGLRIGMFSGGCNSEMLPGLPLVGRGLQPQDGEKAPGKGWRAVPLPGVRVCAR